MQGIANTAWAFATWGHLDQKPFMALASSLELLVSVFNVPGIANTAWAFATAGQLHQKPLHDTCQHFQSRSRVSSMCRVSPTQLGHLQQWAERGNCLTNTLTAHAPSRRGYHTYIRQLGLLGFNEKSTPPHLSHCEIALLYEFSRLF